MPAADWKKRGGTLFLRDSRRGKLRIISGIITSGVLLAVPELFCKVRRIEGPENTSYRLFVAVPGERPRAPDNTGPGLVPVCRQRQRNTVGISLSFHDGALRHGCRLK